MFCRIDYFSTRVENEPGAAPGLLTRLAAQRVCLIAVAVTPAGPDATDLHLFPADPADLAKAARVEGIALEGPRGAVFVQDEDHAGAFAAVLAQLATAGIELAFALSMRDGRGRFGCVIPLDADALDAALRALRSLAPEESTEAEQPVDAV